MDINSIAREGSADELAIYMIDEDLFDMEELPYEAVMGNNVDTLSFLLNNGVGDAEELLQVAEEEGYPDVIRYLRSIVMEDVPEDVEITDSMENFDPYQYMSEVEQSIITDDIDFVKEALEIGSTDIEEVGALSARHANYHILKYALKFGANDFDRMMREAYEAGHPEVAGYLESIDDRGYEYPSY